MSSFVKVSTIPGVQSTQNIQGPGSFGVSQNNIYIFGNRKAIVSPATTLPIPIPAAGYPYYELYQVYELPEAVTFDGNSLVSYFDQCGFTVGWGNSVEQELLNCSLVDNTTYASLTRSIIYYTGSSTIVETMVGSNIVGTFDDTTADIQGTIITAETGSFTISGVVYDSYIVVESAGFATITAADNITFSFIDYSIGQPNPATTEPFIMNLYHAVASASIPDASSNPNRTVSTPKIYFSILPDASHSAYFGPSATPASLVAPTAVNGSVLTFASTIDNSYLIPQSELGTSTITQGTGPTLATGTIESSEINGGSILVTMKDVTGTFLITGVCTLTLDAGQTLGLLQSTLFASLNISLQQLAIPYEISLTTDITTKYKTILDYITTINRAQYSVNGQAICQAVFARIGISDSEALSDLPTNVNSWMYEPVFYNYQPAVSDIVLTAGMVAASYAMVIGSNVFPINPQGGIVLNSLPVSAKSKGTSVQVGSYADSIQKLGWNVVAVNTNLRPFVIAPRTGQTTIPGTSTPDTEFYPEYLWQTIDYCRLASIMFLQSIGLGQIRQTPINLKRIKGELYTIMNGIADAGLIEPVGASQIVVEQDASNPLGIDVTISIQVVPGLYFAYVTFNVFSSLITITTE